MTDTQVVVVGAGPAGLVLARLLWLQGVDVVVLERRSRAYVEAQVRAGMLERPTVDLLREIGVAEGLDRHGLAHRGYYLRFDRRTHHVDLAGITGRTTVNYGQERLVRDLVAVHEADGVPIRFEVEDVVLRDVAGDRPSVELTHGGRTERLRCAVVAGCDGARGVAQPTLLAESARLGDPIRLLRREVPYAWLGILARSRPITPEGMYCAHEAGFSLHSMRGTELTRQYLQVPATSSLADWSDDRIWSELSLRSAADDTAALEPGEILERSLFPLRSGVLSSFGLGRLQLAGDAAHTVPPTGAKGLNLAVGDAVVLARSIAGFLRSGEQRQLDAYSGLAAARVWRGQSFSWAMTSLLHRLDDDPFEWQLRRARLDELVTSRAALEAHALTYQGLPFATGWRFGAAQTPA